MPTFADKLALKIKETDVTSNACNNGAFYNKLKAFCHLSIQDISNKIKLSVAERFGKNEYIFYKFDEAF